MKRLIYTLGFLFSIFSINAVEIANNTSKCIVIGDFVRTDGCEIYQYPILLNVGAKYKGNIVSFIANVQDVNEIYTINGIQENTIVSFIEVDGKIQAHKLDIILPVPGKALVLQPTL